ncbi:MAG: sigma-54 dependent transcriptional regulator [Mucispirillum sp.]|uniref:Sigma-54 dependent transcriptional regulator n=1 Tax=Candidatus Mucispirillum faecigallinarum TaxID=2838699 RepID=A0A9D2KB54_9BACT|nr:sigma-54 dependent transcriptional regulator [Mucispirillum sp.]HIZ89405.1 sigma-54 dependent transcriptional regulator [Candidatus Mucispirillum faecigallinarum]
MKILIIDDEKNICSAIKGILEDEGYECDYSLNYAEGFRKLQENKFDVLFLDIWLPDIDGTEGLKEIKRHFPEIDVIMISGHGTIETAVDTIRYGAYDFLEKPLSLERIVMIIKHLDDKASLMQDLRSSKYKNVKKYDLIGVSQQITRLKERIEKIASMNSWVLITGENGTGKEHVARLIHMLGKRADKPFVEINCSAVPTELIESELFGSEKGAYTGSVKRKIGKFELADGGVLFLDEIGDMGLMMQAKLLRVLETGEFSRLGGNEIIKSDFRLISATNKDLQMEIQSNRFRSDLFYRINVIPIEVPPLRQRKDDIPLLVNHFVQETVNINGLQEKQITDKLMDIFINYDWPGNVRQLKNIVERMVVLSEDDVLDVKDAPNILLSGSNDIEIHVDNNYSPSLKEARDEFEKTYILKALQANNWNVTQTARILDMERTYLYRKIKAYDLEKYKK